MPVLSHHSAMIQSLKQLLGLLVVVGLLSSTLHAQGTVIPGQNFSGSIVDIPEPDGPGVGGMGLIGRIGHEAAETVGRTKSITYFDISPYVFVEETMIFGDGRLFLSNSGGLGGTAGLGFRHFFASHNTVAGVSFYYDRDDHRRATFEQFGISGEVFTEWLDVRTNIYIPFGRDLHILGSRFEPGSQRFVGNNIQFQTRTDLAAALEGGDMMFTVPIPGDIPQSANVEASAGWYHYQARGLDIKDIWGWKLRLDADLMGRLAHTFVEFSSDDVFDKNVLFGADVNYWHHLESRERIGKSQYNRIAQWVRRNRHVAAIEDDFLDAPQLAINPDTGNPYLVYHVRNVPTPPPANFPAPAGDGSVDMPFQFIREGIDQMPFADIVFVHGNSVYDGTLIPNPDATVIMRPDVLVLGEGAPLTLPVQGLAEEIDLPSLFPGSAPPVIQNVTGPAVTLADGSRFGGFDIQNVTGGSAIFANGVDSGRIDSVNILTTNGPVSHGLELLNTRGAFAISNVTINGTEGDAIHIEDNTATILFEGANEIMNSSGYSAFIQDSAGNVNLRNTSITDMGGLGILVQGTAPTLSRGNITFEDAVLTGTNPGLAAPAVLIDNHSAGTSFVSTLTIDGNNGDGIVITDLQPTGSVTFADTVTINNRNAHGILVTNIAEGPSPVDPTQDVAGRVTFQDSVAIGPQVAGTAPGLLFSSSSGVLELVGGAQNLSISVNGSGGTGIEISNTADTGVTQGQFISRGLITIMETVDTAFTVENVLKQNYAVRTNGITVDTRGGVGINVSNFGGTAQILGVNTINNNLGQFVGPSTAPAVNITDNFGDVGFGVIDANDVLSDGNPNTGAVNIVDNFASRNVGIASLNVEGNIGNSGIIDHGVLIRNNNIVGTGTGILEIAEGRAITVEDNVRHNLFFQQIDASNDPTMAPNVDFGILVDNSPGRFVVTGLNNLPLSGGLVQGMSVAGASFMDTEVVDISNQEYRGNDIGVMSNRLIQELSGLTPQLNLRTVNINSSSSQGLLAIDTSAVLIENSLFSDNGLGNAAAGIPENHQIEIVAGIDEIDIDLDGDDDIVDYLVTIDRSTISDTPGLPFFLQNDMILIRTDDTRIGNGARLDLFVTNNAPAFGGTIASFRAQSAALNVDWTGTLAATIAGNAFTLSSGPFSPEQMTGVRLNVDGPADVVYNLNTMDIVSTGVNIQNNLGLDFAFNDPAEAAAVQVSNSIFTITGNGSTAMAFTFQGSGNRVFIENNLLDLDTLGNVGTDGMTGILFRRIFGPSSVVINGNQIELENIPPGFQLVDLQDRGIIFQDVRGVINLISNVDNVVIPGLNFPFTIDFDIPQGTSVGSILINGTPRP